MVEITADQIAIVIVFVGGVVTALGVERIYLGMRGGKKAGLCPRCSTPLEGP